jgi:Flp pilus assembly pilin Flp
MRLLKDQLIRFVTEESGQDIIEYALMIVLVALTVAGLAPGVDTAVSKVLSAAVSSLAI